MCGMHFDAIRHFVTPVTMHTSVQFKEVFRQKPRSLVSSHAFIQVNN